MAEAARGGSIAWAQPGMYRPVYKLTAADLDPRVINTIAGEAPLKDLHGVDAVINNMFNRLGTSGKLWSRHGLASGNLLEVARAPGQYAGYRRATEAQTKMNTDRIKAIASSAVPDRANE